MLERPYAASASRAAAAVLLRLQDSPISIKAPYRRNMPWQTIKYGWDNTFQFLGGWGVVVAVVLVPLVGFILHARFGEPQAVKEEFFIWLIYGLAATGLVFPGILAINILAAPQQIERDKRIALEATNTEINQELESARQEILRLEADAPDIAVEITQLAWGGQSHGINKDGTITPAKNLYGTGISFIAMITLRNKGTMQSAIPGVRMYVRRGDNTQELTLHRITTSISVDAGNGTTISLPPSEWLINKVYTPIPEGGIITGFLVATLDGVGELHPDDNAVLVVSVEDVKGRKTQQEMELRGEGGRIPYFRGAEYTSKP